MTETPEKPSIYEETFAKSDKTDAILVVQGKKLHVNKALLSYHSDFFTALFDSEEDSGEDPVEIHIADVEFEDFATFLSLVMHNPLKVTEPNAERLLALGEQYQIPGSKRHVELFLIRIEKEKMEKIRLADRYDMKDLLSNGVLQFKTAIEFKNLRKNEIYQALSDAAKAAICHRFLDLYDNRR
ncbi:unnamed protein product [Caenorhabditis brenneri]